MPLGIRPTVDFVFKLLFGTPENVDLLIDLLNAVLDPPLPIVEVELLNPFNEKEFEDAKLSVVDVKARDSDGAWYAIEVQTSLPAGLRNRLLFYTGELYVRQLREGHSYGELRPAITIWFLTRPLYPQVSSGRLRFLFYDPQQQELLSDQLQVHLVELSKYKIDEKMLQRADPLERWAYFLVESEGREAEELRRLLPSWPFEKATRILEMISRSPDWRPIYDDRAKFELDRYSLEVDTRAEGRELGLAEGRAEGRAKGREEGREEGRAEGRAEGERRGFMMGRIETLQRVLGSPLTDQAALSTMDTAQLEKLASRLEHELQSRS